MERVSDKELDGLSETVEARKAQGAEWITCALAVFAQLLEEIRERRESESKRTDAARKAISFAETKSAGADVIVADAEARRVAAEQRAIAAEARAERLEKEIAEAEVRGVLTWWEAGDQHDRVHGYPLLPPADTRVRRSEAERVLAMMKREQRS